LTVASRAAAGAFTPPLRTSVRADNGDAASAIRLLLLLALVLLLLLTAAISR